MNQLTTDPCPAWCDRLHGPNIPGTRHTTTVLDQTGEVVTATATQLHNGTSPIDIQTYDPEGRELYVLRAVAAKEAGRLFTGHQHPALDQLGRAYTAAWQAAQTVAV